MDTIEVVCTAVENISLAFFQNEIPIVRDLSIRNATGAEIRDVAIHFSSEPPFVEPRFRRLDHIADGAIHHVTSLDLKLDQAVLSGLTASRRAEILIRVEASGALLAERKVDVNLLPPSFWGGSAAAAELLAAFVRPTDSSIDVILREAADKLSKAGRSPAIDGYQTGKKARAWEIAEAIWAALVGHSLAYVLPPKSFERQGQMVRPPADILTNRVGTCLDLALLYASCLEQAGLNPLIVLTEGHAFAGLWLTAEEFSVPVVDDDQALRKRVQLQELVVVETTMLTGDHPARFAQAVEAAARHLAEDAPKPLEFAIDVSRARKALIRPLDLGGSSGSRIEPKVQSESPQELGATPRFEEEDQGKPQKEERAPTRLESWKNGLLDLTLRNRLLNFKDGKSLLIECPDPVRLLDQFALGRGLKVFGRSTVLDGSDGRDPALVLERENQDGRRSYLLEALTRNEIHTQTPEKDTDARLVDLFRAARLAFEEGGANVLFLCLGFLKWQPAEGVGPYRAPLVLVPVQLDRKSVRSGFRLVPHEDEVRFNPTLLQMLRRDFELRIPELEGDLPVNGAGGVDLGKVWKIVREAVKSAKGFEVADQVVLTTLSFTKYLLWKDLVDRTDLLKHNPVVAHLLDTPTHSYGGGGKDFIAPRELDEAVDPADLFTPLSADSSQVAAIVAAERGRDFVLFGPPGTGKSQTIANMITNCLAHGKTVLFVSQKTAALEVVRRRMETIGLGDYCLEVHSTKAQKSEVIAQLMRAWRSRKTAEEEDWSAATGDLKKKRDELNRLVSALHRRRANGTTAYDAFGRVVADRGLLPEVRLSWPGGTVHAPEDLTAMRDDCNALKNALAAVGDPTAHPLRGIEQTSWSPAWSQEFERLSRALRANLSELLAAADAFATMVGFSHEYIDHADIHQLSAYGELLMAREAGDGVLLLGPGKSEQIRALQARAAIEVKVAAKMAELAAPYDARAASRLNLVQLHADWKEAGASNFLVRGARQKKVRALLQACCSETIPADISRDLVLLQDISELRCEAEKLRPSFVGMERLFDAAPSAAAAAVAWAKRMEAVITSLGARTGIAAEIQKQTVLLVTEYADLVSSTGEAGRASAALAKSLRVACETADALARTINLGSRDELLAFVPSGLEALLTKLDRWIENRIKAPPWIHWRAAASAAKRHGIEPLVAAIEAGIVSGEQILPTFEYAYARWVAEEIVNADETLASFLAEHHEATIDAFRAADDRVAELSKRIVFARLGGGVPGETSFGSNPEWGMLAHEGAKKTRHLPLRQLFGKIPTVLTKLTPCVMMSPLSIAQYLPPDSKLFDVVMFDEASQMPVGDAIGAMARGRQVIVAGDPEQLPPTSFGERGEPEEDDGATIQSQQSILDECVACNLPRVKLTWHYRSRHESLIAFSNVRYYRGELVTFPSPVTSDAALRFVPVKEGVYLRGKGRTNRPEAQAVVADVVGRLKSSRDSIGIVTFNAEQQKLIEDLLEQERSADPSLDRFWQKTETFEPVFVKNLENVQGDERDAIIFSCAVGPDETGRVTAQISSLNSDGGYRRLNVAITRARREMVVYSSMSPEQINLGRSNARGIVDFKHFLEFAKHGPRAIAEAFAPTGRDTESPFEDAVLRALEGRNWVVHPQVGVSNFRVDFGIVHPDKPGAYLAGVEADGAQFHRSATARDRDKLRQTALESLGWRILRIWSTEWWLDANAALDKIHQKLEAILDEDRAKAREASGGAAELEETSADRPDDAGADWIPATTVNAPPCVEEACQVFAFPTPEPPIAVAEPMGTIPPQGESELGAIAPERDRQYAKVHPVLPSVEGGQQVYRVADLAEVAVVDARRFYDTDYGATLRKMVDHVVTVEGPIYFDTLVSRIARAHGFQRARGTIRDIVRSALGRGRFPESKEEDQELIWPAGADTNGLWPWRGSGERPHQEIPLVELASFARLRDGLDDEAIVRSLQEALALGRLAGPTRERLQRAIEMARRYRSTGLTSRSE